ncbi:MULTISPECIES: DUF3192 domain-containing protein [Shewanella]|jgi:hypothetical protein|uniref:DUF3192 domain-containing protein n=1 Tax=Shewanella zhuhaiensis TaxID=2919576 RepID=A0AAJ1EYW6_9GAMM|nr:MULTISPECIES: DUF3192 domain-containing protein [Shewanella]MCH4295489.1 DUF3192 domain-containing protein [Shewanella zhuhaiensis]
MKGKAPVVIGSVFAAYLAFVGVVAIGYEPTPENMDWEDRQVFNNKALAELVIGQDIASVRQLLGAPDFNEAKSVNDTALQVLFYRTHHEKSDGVTTKDECTPLLFKNNQLIAWGSDTYKQYLSETPAGI